MELVKIVSEEQIQLDRVAAKGRMPAAVSSHNVSKPILPAYQDREDMALYLSRFEKESQLLKVDQESYAVRLGGLLSGKATEMYTSLDSDTISDYSIDRI